MSFDAEDLFAGPGGWDLAARDLGLRVLGIEWDTAACATRRAAGLPTVEADIRDCEPLSSTAGLIASPPCQTFSTAGNGSGRAELSAVVSAVRTCNPCATFADERTALILEPLRFILTRRDAGNPYRWIALEQVPTVLAVWEAYAEVLRDMGYSVAVGKLSAEQYGVPQTRKRAILIASLDHEVTLPQPTHSAYYPRDPKRLDPGVLPWVPMADALGWGMDERPSMTVCAGGTKTGGAETFGNGARTGMKRERERGERGWIVVSNYGTGGDASRRGIRKHDEPFATVTSKVDRMKIVPNNAEWTLERPSTTVNCDPRISKPGRHDPNVSGSQQKDAIRVTSAEAGVLQSFPADHPWQGTKTKQFEQAGNAIPPLLARAVLTQVALPIQLRLEDAA